MKIQFDSNLDYQAEAIRSIVSVFEGQEICQTNFTVAPLQYSAQATIGIAENNLGIGNRLRLLDEDIHKNIKNTQLENGLFPSAEFSSKDGIHLSVEMETGTGKTYVYLRTIFELHKNYGFTKFIIVVPSIAIKEGVYKTLQITEEHFKNLYDNVCFDYFVYDSSKLSHVRNFATSSTIQIMVINIDAFRKTFDDKEESKANIIHRAHDRMAGTKPIEYIQDTRPIVIIDEPQSVDSTAKSKEAIASLNPLCTLRYSATHADKHHMLYRLNAVDAYEQKLVKQIEVAEVKVIHSNNTGYLKLISVDNKKSPISAKVEIDQRQKTGTIKRKTVTVTSGADLSDKKYSGGRELYDGYIVDDIYCEKGQEFINFTSKPDVLRLGQSIGEVNSDERKRLQIRKTIEEHLEKQWRLKKLGVKVLSLFFIDKVANYRFYDEEGNPQKGKFAVWFEEEYKAVLRKKMHLNPFAPDDDLDARIPTLHNGYFAIDKKKDATGKEMFKDTKGNTATDESAYNLIMKDKEKLLSFDSKLSFIFSHSALREGWDNPNVFQICTLNETSSETKKRQEIGRGLRICVNQQGERVHGFEYNTLTVMANESYEQFAEKLQKEYEEETGIKFGIVEKHTFANITIAKENGDYDFLGVDASEDIYRYLKEKEYIDAKGKVQDSLKTAIQDNTLTIPKEYQEHLSSIVASLKKISGNLNIKNSDDKRIIQCKKAVLLEPNFKELWDRIKYQTTFRVDFDVQKLIKACVKSIQESLAVKSTQFVYIKSQADISRGGVQMGEAQEKSRENYQAQDFALPDIISYLQNETNLTRKTIVQILKDSDRFDLFKKNPQMFIEQVSASIKSTMRLFIVDGIKYQKIGDDYYYAQELFEQEELFGYLNKNMLACDKSVFEYVVYDSDTESHFAKELENNDAVKLYIKLPDWFKIDTPLGTYNPDWAITIEENGKDKCYFVVETKSTTDFNGLRPAEKAKIKCGEAHFEALGDEVEFVYTNVLDKLLV